MNWLDITNDDPAPRYTAPFRELRPPAIPVPYRNHEPPETFACSMSQPRAVGAPDNRKPAVDLTPSEMKRGRQRALAKRKRRSYDNTSQWTQHQEDDA